MGPAFGISLALFLTACAIVGVMLWANARANKRERAAFPKGYLVVYYPIMDRAVIYYSFTPEQAVGLLKINPDFNIVMWVEGEPDGLSDH